MRVLYLILSLLVATALTKRKQETSLREMQATCPTISFQPSYIVSNSMNKNVTITPTFNLNCQGTQWEVQNLGINGISGIYFNLTKLDLVIYEWTPYTANSYYNISVSVLFNNVNQRSQITSMNSYFILIIGSVSIQFTPVGSIVTDYFQDVIINYTTAFDPQQQSQGQLTFQWTCPPIFNGCNQLGMVNDLSALQRITVNRMIFNYVYTFEVYMKNPNPQYLNSATDTLTIQINPPETYLQPTSCISFQLTFTNQNLIYTSSTNAVNITFDNGNYTNVVIGTPKVDVSRCIGQLSYLAFTEFNNPVLFSDMRSWPFNNTNIVISATTIQNALSLGSPQSLNFYVYSYITSTQQVTGYQYITLTLMKNPPTLFPILSKSFIQVDQNLVLYVDGSQSYDSRNQGNLQYNWNIVGYPSVNLQSFNSSSILTLTPQQRTALGINTPGMYYNYSMDIYTSTRISQTVYATVQISPQIDDPNNCVTLQLKDINVQAIIAIQGVPLAFDVIVQKKNCTGLVMQSLIWSCPSVQYQFWYSIGGINNTIFMDRDSVDSLPTQQNIYMTVTQYYMVQNIQYIAQLTFTFLVASPSLVPIVSYPQLININKANLIIDATQSYDPLNQTALITNMTCSWTCNIYFGTFCNGQAQSNNCLLNLTQSIVEANMQIYTNQILQQPQLFTLTLFKDIRNASTSFYVSFIDTQQYPNCSISLNPSFSVNFMAFAYANCVGQPQTYQWNMATWPTSSQIPQTSLIITNEPILRFNPYLFSNFDMVVIQLQATNNTLNTQYTTTIYFITEINMQKGFQQGAINTNYNQFTAYLSLFTLTPTSWQVDSALLPTFQYRLKYSDTPYPQFKVLLSPTSIASQPSINIYLPPITYDNTLYIDVVDTNSNYMTVTQPIASVVDILMNAATFQTRVSDAINGLKSTFDEAQFELLLLQLRVYYQAYGVGQIDLSGGLFVGFLDPVVVSTITQLYNSFVINNYIQSPLSIDRQVIYRQHLIDILFYMTRYYDQPIANQNVLMIMNNSLNGIYYLGDVIAEMTLKSYVVIQTISNYQYYNQFDYQNAALQASLLAYLLPDEQITYSDGNWTFIAMEIGKSGNDFPDLPDFSYNKTTLFNPKFIGGSFIFFRNSTYAMLQISDSQQRLLTSQIGTLLVSPVNIQNPVQVTFTLTPVQIQRYEAGTLKYSCQCRQDYVIAWATLPSKTQLASFDNTTGRVTCLFFILSQYSLQIIDKTNPNSNNNGSSQGTNSTILPPVQNVTGKFNVTLANSTNSTQNGTLIVASSDEILIFNEKQNLFVALAIFVLALFVVSNLWFYFTYKDEHQKITTVDILKEKFEVNPAYGLSKNRCRLYIKLLVHFNPYLNIFMVYNKFLPRWVRNTFLQLYFLAVALIYGINSYLQSNNESKLGNQSLVVLVIIVLFIVLLSRPLAIKAFYKLLYEPDAKVEDNPVTSQLTQKVGINEKSLRVLEFDEEHKHMNEDSGIMRNQSPTPKDTRSLEEISSELNYNATSKKHRTHGSSLFDQEKGQQSAMKSVMQKQVYYDDSSTQRAMFNPIRDILPEQNQVSRNFDQRSNQNFTQQINGKLALVETKLPEYGNNHPIGSLLPPIFEPHQQDNPKKAGFLPDINARKTVGMAAFDLTGLSRVEDQSFQKRKFDETSQISGIQRDSSILSKENQNNQGSFVIIEQDPYKISLNPNTQPQPKDPEEEKHYLPPIMGKPILKSSPNANPFEDFNEIEFEGGEKANCLDDVELVREDSEIEPTNLFNTHMLNTVHNNRQPSEQDQQTEYFGNQDGPRVAARYRPPRNQNGMSLVDVNSSNQSSQPHIQEQESEIMPADKRWFVNKMIGKTILFLTYAALAAGNMLCIERMYKEEFYEWIILSLVTFFFIIFVVDPILYWILCCNMIKSSDIRKAQFFTRRIYKKRRCVQIFIVVLIGREKLRDLKRKLNPIIV